MAFAISILASIIVGAYALKVMLFVWYLIRAFVLTKVGFHGNLKNYGEWAVVTGASDGIGREYAKQLAGYGLNIILISRAEAKLQKVAEEIKKESKVEVRVIVFDFTDVMKFGKLAAELQGLDIGLLVNNVGMNIVSNSPFHDMNVEGQVQIMNVNMISDVRMTHMVLPGMMERKRGAIVHISSIAAHVAVPGLSVYGATKIFMKKFVETLLLESKGIIDHQIVTPGVVESNMSGKKPGFTVPATKKFVSSAIKTIGVVNETCGYPTHDLINVLTQMVPAWIIAEVFTRQFDLDGKLGKTK